MPNAWLQTYQQNTANRDVHFVMKYGWKYFHSACGNNALSETQTSFLATEDYPQQYKLGSTYCLHMNPVLMQYLENERTNKCV